MRRDKNAPALLELIGKGTVPEAKRPVPPTPRAPAVIPAPSAAPRPAPAPISTPSGPPPEDTSTANWFSPGRAIRVPTGYLVPLGLLVLVLIVGAYTTGYQRRKAEETSLQSANAAQDMTALVDPLNQPEPARQPAVQQSPTAPLRAAQAPKARETRIPPPVSKPTGYVLVKSKADDPRQAGLNYLIAATLPPDEAEKAAEFLVSKGLEIAVVSADNASLRWVVVLQGVAAKDLSGPAAQSLEQRLQTLGREYKQVHKGPTVFNDPWWKKHTK